MPRAATTSDVFNAIAEPRRRELLDLLSDGEWPVSDLVEIVDLDQPGVSKHLRVLREVGLVQVRREGRRRLYRADGTGLKAVHDWTKTYERYWAEHLDRVKAHAERKAREQAKKPATQRRRAKGDHQ